MKTPALFALVVVPCLAACSVAGPQNSIDEAADVDAPSPTHVGRGAALLGRGAPLVSAGTRGTTAPSGVPFSETCAAGDPITLTPDVGTVHVTGTTVDGTDDKKTFCGDPDAETSSPDITFPVTLTEGCTLNVSLTGQDDFEPVFELRTVCDSEGAGDAYYCVNGSNAQSLTHSFAAGTYYLVIDGQLATSGDFDVALTCTTDKCGDGAIGAGEQCDSGPGATPNDGCGDPGGTNECQLESTPAADTCEGVDSMIVHLDDDKQLPASGAPYSTIGAGADYLSTDPDYPVLSPDQVFAFTPDADGVMKITVGMNALGTPFCDQSPYPAGCWNHMLYVREDDCENGSQIAEAVPDFEAEPSGNVQVSFDATAGHTYYLFVSGTDMTEYDLGPYFLQVAMQAEATQPQE
jgi:hypothetical protein